MRVSGPQRVQFFRSLATLFHSGVGLHRAVQLLGEQQDDPYLGEVYNGVAQMLAAGHTLSRAASNYPAMFARLNVRLLAVGEKTGALATILERIADYEERQSELRLKVRKAVTMPAILVVLCMVVIVVFPPFVLRGILEMLIDSRVELPLMTRILILVSSLLRNPLVVLGSLAAVAALGWWLGSQWRDPAGLRRLSALGLALPGLGPTLRQLAVARFARAYELLLEAGVLASQAMRLAGEASGNAVLAERIKASASLLESGAELHESLAAAEFFPESFLQTLEVGQESGRLSSLVADVANLFEAELEHRFELLAATVEPFALAFIGGVVAFVLVAVMLPMMEMMKAM
ncbi:MAG: type II secretion system F family protein [Vulcanimicrobiota bacterium]